ncbi:MAG: hypothetical protein M3410_08895, partial [Acidobacteriota bacterium]|nr:hypothetical protein [Acidobacteriota bacterium]
MMIAGQAQAIIAGAGKSPVSCPADASPRKRLCRGSQNQGRLAGYLRITSKLKEESGATMEV